MELLDSLIRSSEDYKKLQLFYLDLLAFKIVASPRPSVNWGATPNCGGAKLEIEASPRRGSSLFFFFSRIISRAAP